MTDQATRGARLQLSIIALVFFGPLIVATWMYLTGQLHPEGRSNHGALLEPVTNLGEVLPSSPIVALADGRWIMLYANDAECGAPCLEALIRLRQVRLMLGHDMGRVVRAFLRGDAPLDTVLLEEQHVGLNTISDKGLTELLQERRPEELPPGGIFLIDPLTNLVMYFSPEIDPGDLVEDVEHLLELSRIG